MLEFFKTDIGIAILLTLNLILFISVVVSNLRINRIKKNSNEFMRKLGNSKDIKEDINKYMERIVDIEAALSETNTYCKQLDKQMENCMQKVGIVRYNAYKDAGSNLSFAVALLDENNNGVVFNGIYSREMSNTYAKPIENGKSKYTMTDEEIEAVNKAIKEKE